MDAEKEKNDQVSDDNLNFELVKDDDSEDFHEPETDKKAIEAEVLSETKIEPPANELTGVAALLANLNTEEEVSVIVTRLKDGQFKGQFRVPCEIDGQVETVAWDGEMYPDSIYRYIKKTYGGGRYRFQLRYGGGFKESWKETLSDPSELSDKEKLAQKNTETKTDEQPRKSESSQPFVNHQSLPKTDTLDELINQVGKMKTLQEMFTPPAAPTPTAAPPSNDEPKVTKETIKMAIVEKAMNNPALLEQALKAVFDIAPDKNPRPAGFWESIGAAIMTNPQITEMLLNSAASVAAPLANLAMTKLMPMPTAPDATTPTAPPIVLRKPAINNQPPPAQPPTQPAPMPRTTAEPPTQPTAADAPPARDLPEIPLIKLK